MAINKENYVGVNPAVESPDFNKNLRKSWGAFEYLENVGLSKFVDTEKYFLSSYDPDSDLQPTSVFTAEVDYDNRLIPGIFVTILGFGKKFSGRALLKKVETYINFREGIKQRITLLVNEKIPLLDDIEVDIEDEPLIDLPPKTPTGTGIDIPSYNPDIGTPTGMPEENCETFMQYSSQRREDFNNSLKAVDKEMYEWVTDDQKRMETQMKDPKKYAEMQKKVESHRYKKTGFYGYAYKQDLNRQAEQRNGISNENVGPPEKPYHVEQTQSRVSGYFGETRTQKEQEQSEKNKMYNIPSQQQNWR